MKILIVDDSILLRSRVVALLSEFSVEKEISQATTCEEAISRFHDIRPDLVILDVRLPDGSGIDVLKEIQRNRGSETVVMLTNYPYKEYQVACKEMGADYFFCKSRDFERLRDVMDKLSRNGFRKEDKASEA